MGEGSRAASLGWLDLTRTKDGLGNLKKRAQKCQRRMSGEQVSASPHPTRGGDGRSGGSRGTDSSWRDTLGPPEEAARCSGI